MERESGEGDEREGQGEEQGEGKGESEAEGKRMICSRGRSAETKSRERRS